MTKNAFFKYYTDKTDIQAYKQSSTCYNFGESVINLADTKICFVKS